jgi:ribosomal protein S18 acetylase RimI-like enzyme
MDAENYRRFDREEYPWLTPEIPTETILRTNPGYKIRRVHDVEKIKDVFRRQLVDCLLSSHGCSSFAAAPDKMKKKIKILSVDIDKAVEESVNEIVWAILTQTNEIVKIIDVNNVQKLKGDAAHEFQKLLLDGLMRFPWAFGTTFDDECRKGTDEVAEWIESRDVYGVYHKDYHNHKQRNLVGIGRIERKKGASSHEGYMGSLYVDPEHWGNRIGDALTRRRLDRAIEMGLASVEITVTATNKGVLDYYQKLGFLVRGERTGIIKGKSYPWVDLWLPMEIWKKKRNQIIKT